MLWHILKYLLAFSIPSFYRKMSIKNSHYLKNNKPAIIVSNHPNAFMDPIAFSYLVYPPRIRYMARGDAFKPGIISKLLQSIGIIPIFRMQDAGAKGVKKNIESYKIVYQLLKKNKKIMIFAEGICIQEKRLRPIKKGVPRLIYSAQLEIPHTDILIIPVCLNYSNPSQIGSTLFIYVGEPFTVTNKMQEYLENPNAAMQQMMKDIYKQMRQQIIHIERPENDDLFEKTRYVLSYVLCQKKKLNANNLEHLFIVEKEIAECINQASEKYPEHLSAFAHKINLLYTLLTNQDIHIPSLFEHTLHPFILFIKALFYALVYIPYRALYQIVTTFMYIPYKLSDYLSKKLSPSKEFYASFFLAFSTFLFLFYYIGWFFILKNYCSPILILLFFAGTLAFIPLIHYYSEYRAKLITLLKILKNKTFALNLSKNIQQILRAYEQLQANLALR